MTDFSLNSWTTGDADIETDIRVAGAAGYRYVELRDAKIEAHLAAGGSLAGIRGWLDAAGIGVLSVNTLDDATLHEGAELESRVARCRALCGFAQALGAPFVIVGPSYRSEGDGLDAETIGRRTAAALARFSAVAADHGVRIGFEFHGYSRCSIHTLADAAAALDRLDNPAVGVVVDAFHFYVGGSRLDDLAALDPARLFIVHLADVEHADRGTLAKPDRVFPGLGVMPLSDIVAAVKRTGYQGAYSLELFRPDYWAMDPAVVARRGLDSMRQFA